mgnify:CR=1 FL=1
MTDFSFTRGFYTFHWEPYRNLTFYQCGLSQNTEPVEPSLRKGGTSNDWRLNAGTITCDGKFRGTAMVVDTHEFAPAFEGAVLVTAAHVLYDLDRNRFFKRCKFYFMGWSKRTGYLCFVRSLLMAQPGVGS